jgi:hypothetical protein
LIVAAVAAEAAEHPVRVVVAEKMTQHRFVVWG